MSFEELGLCPELLRACEENGWLLPTPVQAEAVPLILGGGDVMAAAETGRGKTAAFALPGLQVVRETLAEERRSAERPSEASAAEEQPAAPQVVMNAHDRDAALAISPDGLLCQARRSAAASLLAAHSAHPRRAASTRGPAAARRMA